MLDDTRSDEDEDEEGIAVDEARPYETRPDEDEEGIADEEASEGRADEEEERWEGDWN